MLQAEADKITLWFKAVLKNDLATLASLIREGFNINTPHPSQNEMTALHIAAYHGNQALLTYLLQQGADVNLQDEELSLPIHFAVEQGQGAAIACLITHGSQRFTLDSDQLTPLALALNRGHKEAIQYLLRIGAGMHADLTALQSMLSQEQQETFFQGCVLVGASVEHAGVRQPVCYRGAISSTDQLRAILSAEITTEAQNEVASRTNEALELAAPDRQAVLDFDATSKAILQAHLPLLLHTLEEALMLETVRRTPAKRLELQQLRQTLSGLLSLKTCALVFLAADPAGRALASSNIPLELGESVMHWRSLLMPFHSSEEIEAEID